MFNVGPNIALESGQLDKGKSYLDKVPNEAVGDDPMPFINVGILFMNKQSNPDALVYFDRAIEVAPAEGLAYYYRGLMHMPMGQLEEAKRDSERQLSAM